MAVMDPDGVAFDGSGNLYISDDNLYNTMIRRVDLSTGLIYTVAGSGSRRFYAATAARRWPRSSTIRRDWPSSGGAVYFADVVERARSEDCELHHHDGGGHRHP